MKISSSIIIFLLLIHTSSLAQGFKNRRVDDSNKQTKRLEALNPSYKNLTPELINEMYERTLTMPGSNDSRNDDGWESIGPNKILGSPISFTVSGRVRDVDVVSDSLIRFAAASGGLWESRTLQDGTKEIKELSLFKLPSVAGGAVATDPSNENVILFGTGETFVRSGSGFYRSEDGGESWTRVVFPMEAATYTEIEYSNIKDKVWCASENGVFKSLNNGKTWQLMRAGHFSGLAIDPNHPDTVYVGQYNGTILKSVNGGKNWTSLGLANGLPTTDVARIELTICESFPNVLYAFYTNNQNLTLGLYRTDDSGQSWTKCNMWDADGNIVEDIHWGQGWYNSFAAVSPVNPNLAIAGGGWYVVSNDGINFTGPITPQHPDFHAGNYSKDGSLLFVGNDGGVYGTKTDEKYNWDASYNAVPITQFGTIAVSKLNPKIILGGTQDNGIVYYHLGTNSWFNLGGDGGGVGTHPYNEKMMYGTIGLYGGNITFRNVRKKNSNIGEWEDINNGIGVTHQWGRYIKSDHNNPNTIYTTAGNTIYRSEDNGDNWSIFTSGDVPYVDIGSIAISKKELPNIYFSGVTTDSIYVHKIDTEVFDFINISDGLPRKYLDPSTGNTTFPFVYTYPSEVLKDNVYVVMRGMGNHIKNKRVFASEDNGSTWENISGNLPDLPFTCLQVHPYDPNVMVLGTDGFGIYHTNNGGKNWSIWNENVPTGALITDIDYYQSETDSVFVFISTYGNGIYKRYLAANEVSSTQEKSKSKQLVEKMFYADGNIIYILKENNSKNLSLKIYDVGGKPISYHNNLSTIHSLQHYIKINNQNTGNYIAVISRGSEVAEILKFKI